jgi:hypothetical protein
MELIKISDELLKKIKNIIDREQLKDKKNVGFSQLSQWYATQKMSLSQAQQIISFYNHYSDNKSDNKEEKKRIYDELKLLPWCQNQIRQFKNITASKRKAKKTYTTNRTIDRMNTINTASVKPTPPPTTDELKEGLKMKTYRVTYTANKTRYVTTLHLYSQSETQAIERLKMTNYRLRNKQITILNIVPLG